MCKKKFNSKMKFRSAVRTLEVGQEICLKYNPEQMNISTMRVSASSLGTDLGRKYKVSKQDDKVIVSRIS